ncbi:uncharacterized protein LOC119524552 isoform X2 [Choloepus didactylus]|uniref:uncharacterized protein LOC119524552 isoform X2 n=1 Tax=Choloepus didactylus TaxID=27675 RepID=UPI00189D4E0B|nr:uncharacterized protein LOC119524552 isoform X2 [Choloepus didactylus]
MPDPGAKGLGTHGPRLDFPHVHGDAGWATGPRWPRAAAKEARGAPGHRRAPHTEQHGPPHGGLADLSLQHGHLAGRVIGGGGRGTATAEGLPFPGHIILQVCQGQRAAVVREDFGVAPPEILSVVGLLHHAALSPALLHLALLHNRVLWHLLGSWARGHLACPQLAAAPARRGPVHSARGIHVEDKGLAHTDLWWGPGLQPGAPLPAPGQQLVVGVVGVGVPSRDHATQPHRAGGLSGWRCPPRARLLHADFNGLLDLHPLGLGLRSSVQDWRAGLDLRHIQGRDGGLPARLCCGPGWLAGSRGPKWRSAQRPSHLTLSPNCQHMPGPARTISQAQGTEPTPK